MERRSPFRIPLRSTPAGHLALALLRAAAFLPGLSAIPPFDRDEPRDAQATRQMLESGDYVRIRFHAAPRHENPVGVYWLQALAVSLLGGPGGNAIRPYRLPSLAAATGAVLGTFALGQSVFDPQTALLGAALLAASLLVGVEARLATTDAVLLFLVVVAQLSLAHAYLGRPSDRRAPPAAAFCFWAALALGILVKGAVIVAVSGLTIAALALADRDAAWTRRLRASPGLAVAAVIPAPWMIAIGAPTGGTFFRDAPGGDLLPTLVSGSEGHGAPPGYHAALFPWTFWPGSLLALVAVPWMWHRRSDPAVRFRLAWIVAGAAAAVGLAIVPAATDRRVDLLAVAAGAATLAVVAIGGWLMTRHPRRAAVAVIVGGVLVHLLTFQYVLPRLRSVWLRRAVAMAVRRHAAGARPVVALAGCREPSLIFLLGTATIVTDAAGAAEHLRRDPAGLAVVDARVRPAFEDRLRSSGISPKRLARIDGLNYSAERRQVLELYAR